MEGRLSIWLASTMFGVGALIFRPHWQDINRMIRSYSFPMPLIRRMTIARTGESVCNFQATATADRSEFLSSARHSFLPTAESMTWDCTAFMTRGFIPIEESASLYRSGSTAGLKSPKLHWSDLKCLSNQAGNVLRNGATTVPQQDPALRLR